MPAPTKPSDINLSPLPGKRYFNLIRVWREEFIYFLLVDRFHDEQSLKVSDFDTSTSVVYLTVKRLKGSHKTRQPLLASTQALLLSWIAEKKPYDYVFPGRQSPLPFKGSKDVDPPKQL